MTIIRGDEIYRFDYDEKIPTWLERETDAALREHRATVTFSNPSKPTDPRAGE